MEDPEGDAEEAVTPRGIRQPRSQPSYQRYGGYSSPYSYGQQSPGNYNYSFQQSPVYTPEAPLEDPEAMKARWRNRRRMAWLSLLSLLFLIQEMIILSFIMSPQILEAVGAIIITGIFVLASVVGAYMGLATLSDAGFWQRKR